MKTCCVSPRLIVSLLACLSISVPLLAQWTRTPGPEGGFAAALLSSQNVLLLGMENGGVYRSTDDGATWLYASLGLTGEGPGGYALVSLGTQVFVSTGSGISRSVDQGQTWTTANNGLPWYGPYVSSFAVRGTSAIFAGTDCGGFSMSSSCGSPSTIGETAEGV